MAAAKMLGGDETASFQRPLHNELPFAPEVLINKITVYNIGLKNALRERERYPRSIGERNIIIFVTQKLESGYAANGIFASGRLSIAPASGKHTGCGVDGIRISGVSHIVLAG